MVIISLTKIKKHHISIRWQILLAFLLIVGISFLITASSLTRMVSNNLYQQRVRQDSLSAEKTAAVLAPLFQSADSLLLYENMLTTAGELGGRILITDMSGKIQADTFGTMCGQRLPLRQVADVITGVKSTSYGIYALESSSYPSAGSSAHVAYCASLITGTTGPLGALVTVTPVDEMISSLRSTQQQIIIAFAAVALCALFAALIFSHLFTRPVTSLSRTIRKMGNGDLTVRATVQGSGEFRELAENYNTMANQLESLDQSRNQFVSNASHELKTPLTTMKVLLQTISYQPDLPDDLRTEFLQDIDHEIDRLTQIVTDLLTLTRGDGQALKLDFKPCDLSRLTHELEHKLSPVALKRQQHLMVHVPDELVIDADESKLGQVFYNLTENALKYTHDGGMITVNLEKRGRNVIWSVTDNGVGISDDDLQHIFERFYRVDKARSRETGGTGLGLSIVKQMVSLHGGTIDVESTPGEGSCFKVSLPIRREDAE